MENILKELRKELKNNADKKTKESGQRFFKETVKIYGVKLPLANKIAANLFKNRLKDKSKNEIFKLCQELFESGYLEESAAACTWAYSLRKQYQEKDFKVFEKWLKFISNWASCDTLCNHTVAAFIEMFPKYISKLKVWAKSENRWVKRAAAVTLIIPARKGLFLKDIFEIADILLKDNDDLVQKGYGWMLKAASQAKQKEVFEYIMKNRASMPRTALRYSIEKMPAELKKEAMAK